MNDKEQLARLGRVWSKGNTKSEWQADGTPVRAKCPDCGGKGNMKVIPSIRFYQIVCQRCSNYTPSATSRKQALKLWGIKRTKCR
jgi:ribosomal protein S27E